MTECKEEEEEKETNELYGLAREQMIQYKKVGGHISSLDKFVT